MHKPTRRRFRGGRTAYWMSALVTLALVVSTAGGALAQDESKLIAPDRQPQDKLGSAVAIDGDLAIVGAPGADAAAGSAYVYVRCDLTWRLAARLTASDAGAGAKFGSAVAISGSTALVGAPKHGGGGSTYVFERDASGAWSQVQRLTAPDAADGDGFGSSVAISVRTAVIGAPSDDDGGSAHVFVRDASGTWSRQRTLTVDGEGFGRFVDVSGDTVVAALPSKDTYVFTRDGSGDWVEQQTLGEYVYDHAGESVAIDGDTILIGRSGRVYVFTRDAGGEWSERAEVRPAESVGSFGDSVALSGDTAVIGAPGASFGSYYSGNDRGAAYVFTRDAAGTWHEQERLTASDAKNNVRLGTAVAISGGVAVVGAPFEGDGTYYPRLYGPRVPLLYDAGAAYCYVVKSDLTPPDTVADDWIGRAIAISGDTAAVAASDGSVFVSERGPAGGWREQQQLPGTTSRTYVTVAMSGDTLVLRYSYKALVYTRDETGTWGRYPQSIYLSGGSPAYGSDFTARDVAISSDTIVIGTSGYRVSVYERDSAGVWSVQQTITPSNPSGAYGFGASVAISGDTLVVGAYRSSDDGSGSGSAYIFTRDAKGTWSERQKLTASDANRYAYFGRAVAISGGTLVVGADGADTTYSPPGSTATYFGRGYGAAYVFRRDAAGIWNEEQKLATPYSPATDEFGRAVAIADDTIVVGAPRGYNHRWGTSSSANGSAHVFRREATGVWTHVRHLTAPDVKTYDQFGSSVAISGTAVAVGAFPSTSAADGAGSVFVYSDLGDRPGLEILEATLPDSTVGAAFRAAIESVGGPRSVFYDVTHGTLPPGLTLDADTGEIEGTCADAGTYAFVVRASGPCGHGVTRPFTIAVHAAPEIRTTSLPAATTGRPCRHRLEVVGGADPLAWTLESGELPVPGLLDPVTGEFGGDALAPGDYEFTVRVTDAHGARHQKLLRVSVNAAPRITTSALAECTTGRPYDQPLEMAGGTAPFTWTLVSGRLPVTGDVDRGTGRLVGDAAAPGTWDCTLRVTDANGASGERSFRTVIHELPQVVTSSLPVPVLDRPFAARIEVTGGMAPFTWIVARGDLPPGLEFDAVSSGLRGTPTARGRSKFTLRCVDAAGAAVERRFILEVVPVADLSRGKLTTDLSINLLNGTAPILRALELVAGTRLDVAVRFSGPGAFPVELDVVSAARQSVVGDAARKASARGLGIKGIVVPATGRYFVRLRPLEPLEAGMRLSVKVKAPRKVGGVAAISAGGTVEVSVGALAGSRLDVLVSRARGSTAAPAILSVRDADGNELLEPSDLKTTPTRAQLRMKRPVAKGGTLRITLGAVDGTAGEVAWSVSAKPPRGYVHLEPDLAAGSSE